MAGLTLQEITSEQQFADTTSSSPSSLFILYFHTPWAAPCVQMNTILSTLASTYPSTRASDLSFLSINAEELPEISEEYDVTAVPFTVISRNGKFLESISGSDASKVRSAVEKYAGTGSSPATNGNSTIPPALKAEPQVHKQSTQDTNGAASANGGVTKDLSGYKPGEGDQQTVNGQETEARDDLNERLGKLVKAAPVMLFMKGTPSAPQCGFSRQLVSILRENQVKYGFFNILADDEVRQGLKAFSDWPTFPQLYTNGELIGGLDIVREEMEADPDFFTPYRATATA
ncbi:glutaredoxin [Cladophialophora chaetospira]|uniref:Glutaredoxin n=1 Tax=Cladophialophora chaetospira TaxID=386627 RepID=A0AA38X9Q1_9EURO|nr:glutaredoxin [Cladophialophora chaetospira]